MGGWRYGLFLVAVGLGLDVLGNEVLPIERN